MPNMRSVTGIWVKMSITSPRTGMELTNPISTSNTGGNCSAVAQTFVAPRVIMACATRCVTQRCTMNLDAVMTPIATKGATEPSVFSISVAAPHQHSAAMVPWRNTLLPCPHPPMPAEPPETCLPVRADPCHHGSATCPETAHDCRCGSRGSDQQATPCCH